MADTYTPEDQFEEEINFIRTTDEVLGDPIGTTGTLTGPINVLIQKVVNSLLNLKNRLDAINTTQPNATTTTRGIAELATQVEAETGEDTTRITPPKRVFDILKHANAQATDAIRGTAKIATTSEIETGTDNETIVTPAGLSEALTPSIDESVIFTDDDNLISWNINWQNTTRHLTLGGFIISSGTARIGRHDSMLTGGTVVFSIPNTWYSASAAIAGVEGGGSGDAPVAMVTTNVSSRTITVNISNIDHDDDYVYVSITVYRAVTSE